MALTILAAQGPAATVRPEKSFTGIISFVDPAGKVLEVKGPVFHKRFNVGNTCSFMLPGQTSGTMADLRPGEKVNVAYAETEGVLVADNVTQKRMRFDGVVQRLDPQQHLLIVRHHLLDKQFQLADACSVVLHDDQPGNLANVRPGEHVTVVYEMPAGHATAREIEQTSATFTGELTALDLSAGTLRAKALLGAKQFNVGNDCVIVLSGKPGGHLRDLQPGAKLTVSYHEVNGICVANRIAEGGDSGEHASTQTAMSH